jgi:histidinol dehydrogenase
MTKVNLGRVRLNQDMNFIMLNYLDANKKNFLKKIKKALSSRRGEKKDLSLVVKKIIKDVKMKDDAALIKYEKKFSRKKNINSNNIKFSNLELKAIINLLDKKTKKNIDLAYNRIFKFHQEQKFHSYKIRDNYNNTFAYIASPIKSVGVYVPGGTANYPSTVLMNCIPANIAGVKEIYMTTPSNDNIYNSAVLYAAKKCGVKEIYKIGGAQAVAALAYGTRSVKKVDKIVGPGNQYVALAKKEVFGDVGIDMIAGPSEVTIIGDNSSNPEWIAADLIAQAEHDIKSQSILVTDNRKLIKQVNSYLKKQLKSLPKQKIALASLKSFGYSIYCKSNKQIIKIIDEIAPEHLEICTNNPEKILNKISNAGSVFLGHYSPEAIGDYLAGPNHVLPTSGSAKFSSGLSVYDFLKRHSIIKITKSGIERLGTSVINLAKYENLHGHANSVKIRLKGK